MNERKRLIQEILKMLDGSTSPVNLTQIKEALVTPISYPDLDSLVEGMKVEGLLLYDETHLLEAIREYNMYHVVEKRYKISLAGEEYLARLSQKKPSSFLSWFEQHKTVISVVTAIIAALLAIAKVFFGA